MKKLFKYTGYFFAALLSLLVILVVVLKLIPDTQYKAWISAAAQSATGRDVSIGTLQLDIGTSLRVRADKVRMANADWAEQKDMLQLEHLEADFGLLALLTGKADIRAVVERAEVLAQNNAEGVSNWAVGTKEPDMTEAVVVEAKDPASGLPLYPFIREIRIDDFTLTLMAEPGAAAKTVHVKQLLVETPEKDTTLALVVDLDGHPVELTGSLGDMQQFLDKASEPILLTGDANGNSLALSGNWGPLYPKQVIDINVDIKIPSTAQLAEFAGLGNEEMGAIEISGKVFTSDSLFSLDPLLVTLDGPNADITIKGAIADLANVEGINISTDANSAALEELMQQLKIELPVALPPEVTLNAQINGGLDELALSDLVVLIKDEGVDIKATASIGDLLNTQQINGQLTGTIDSLSHLSKYAQLDLPTLGKIQLSGDIASNDKALKLSNLKMHLNSDNIGFEISGGVDDLLTVDGINALLTADIQSFTEQNITELTQLLNKFDVALPVEMLPQSIKLSAGVRGNLEQISLIDIQGEVLDKGVEISLAGGVENVLIPTGVEANVTLKSDSVAAFSKYAGSELPELGPLEVTAQLVSREETYSVTSLKAHLNDPHLKAELLASVADLLAVSGIEAELNTRVESLDTLSELAQTELPQTDPLSLKATLTEDASNKPNFAVHAETGEARVDINGKLDSLAVPDQLAVAVSVTAANMTDFDRIAQMEFPDQGPLDLSANLQLQKNNFAVNDLILKLDDQSALGNLALTLPENESDITVVNGKLDIPYLDLAFLLPKPTETPAEEEEQVEAAVEEPEAETDAKPVAAADAENSDIEAVAAVPTDRLFSSDPILVEQLKQYDVDLSINAGEIDLGKTDLKDVQIVVKLKDGQLNAEPIKARGGAGTINGYVRIDGQSNTPKLDMDLTTVQVPMPNIGGKLDLNLDLTGEGQSVAALMGSLNGQALVVIRDGKIDSSLATSFGSGLFSFSGGKDYTDLECAILRVDVVDGIADFDNKLAAQLTEVTWRGGGEINLKTEELHAGIKPKPRKGIPISAGSLASLMYVGGTLKHPQPQLNPTDVAVKYAKYSAYVATGGLSFVAEAIKNKVQANQDVCERILDGTVFDEGEGEGEDEDEDEDEEASEGIDEQEQAAEEEPKKESKAKPQPTGKLTW